MRGLKPCPFCGDDPMKWYELIPWSPITIACVKCNAQMQSDYDKKEERERAIKKLVKRWNTRIIPT